MQSGFSIKYKNACRVRLKCDNLNQNIDEKALKYKLESFDFIKTARLNLKIKNLILEFEKDRFDDVIKSISSLNLNEFKKAFISSSKPDIAPVLRSFNALMLNPFLRNRFMLTFFTIYAAYPLFKEGFSDLRSKGLSSKVLESLAVAVSMIRGDFLAANSTNMMLSIGEYIEESTIYKSDDLIKELARPSVLNAWIEIEKNGKTIEEKISVKDLKVGDIVIVYSGDTIPVDGHVLSENATVNQVSMTGEAEPVLKTRGDKVISGTIVEEGRLRIWAEQVGEETATARIKKYIQSSLNEKSSIGLKASELAEKLVPITLGLSLFSYAYNRNLQSVASVLQADYSCALKLATPVAFKSAISQAGKGGILVKGAKTLEALSEVDTFVFDKTGTLTYGNLDVVDVISYDEKWNPKQILDLTASAEEHYFHPVAQAVVEAAKNGGFKHIRHDEVQFIVAHGVKTLVKGKQVIIGSRHFLQEDEKVDFSNFKELEEADKKTKTLLYISYDGKLLGTIVMIDKVRENAKDAIEKLKKLGIKEIVMLTGDSKIKAQKIADEVGVDTLYADLLPTQKALKVQELKQNGAKIAFVGDGINDAPALVNANVGISMFKGADIAKATADISLLKDDINAVVEAKVLANKTIKRINGHFKTTVSVNTFILLGATFGLFSPIITALLHNGTTIMLLFNSIQKISLKGANDAEKTKLS